MSLALSPFSRYILELRLGRMNGVMEFLDANPQALNKKIKSSATTNESFLELATRFDKTNIVLLLKNRGASETPQTAPSLLARSIINFNDTLVEIFTSWGWDPWDGSVVDDLAPPIYTAMNTGYMFALKLWEKNGVDFTKKNGDGDNLLHIMMKSFAVSDINENLQDIAIMLMKKGVSWDALNKEGVSPKQLCVNPKCQQKLSEEWERLCAKKSKKVLLNAINTNVEENVSKKRRL